MIGTKVIHSLKTKHNGDIKVIKSWGWGTYIQSGGLTQSGGVINTLWRQVIKKIKKGYPLFNSFLILGLGGGTVVKAIKENYPDADITGVDIDPDMIDLGEKYLNLDKSDLKVVVGDAMNNLSKKYDLVVVDLYNGDKFPKKFESQRFLKSLTKNKMVVFNRLYHKGKREESDNFFKTLKKYFKNVEIYRPSVNIIYLCMG